MSVLADRWVICDPGRVGWFAQALKDAMAETGASAKQVADRLGTSPSHIRKWRAGSSVPSVERAAEIAHAVGVPTERLCLPPATGLGGGVPGEGLPLVPPPVPDLAIGQRGDGEPGEKRGRRAANG